MELKVGDKVRLLVHVPWAEVHAYYLKGSELIITEKLVDGSYFAKNGYGKIARIYNRDFKKVEEDEMRNKTKMVVGENRIVECGEYIIKWCYGKDYLSLDYSTFIIYKNSEDITHFKFRKHNYKQQMEIVNLILDKLGLNVELVEEDNNEVLEQIRTLEAELEKLRGMIK